MFDRGLEGEYVAIDCETMTSERFEAVVRPDANMDIEAIKIHRLRLADIVQAPPIRKSLGSLLRFIGGRPLVGYYLDFDIAMDKYVLPMIGIELPNERIEISRLYYKLKYGNAPPNTSIDLSFAAILDDLRIPPLAQHHAFNDALMTAMMFVQLHDLAARNQRILRQHTGAVHAPTGA
jgi:DNA polymerase III subunit epsilon